MIPPDLRHATEDRPISGKPELKAVPQIVHFQSDSNLPVTHLRE
jgi:hypothetical protein